MRLHRATTLEERLEALMTGVRSQVVHSYTYTNVSFFFIDLNSAT